MKKPFFSIIIPTLNEEKYLPGLLSDLAAQTFRDFEMILADGHSDDQTVDKTKAFKAKLPSLKIINSPKRHVCVQRNLGAEVAKADTLIFMDADNRLPPYFLQGVKYRLESNPAPISTFFAKPESSKQLDKSFIAAINIALEAAGNLKLPIIQEAMIIVNKKSFLKIGGFDEKVDYIEGRKFLEDAFKLGLSYKIYRDPTYSSSSRRFQAFGKIRVVNNLIAHELSRMLGIKLTPAQIAKLYPMRGGTLFEESPKKRQDFFSQFRKLLES